MWQKENIFKIYTADISKKFIHFCGEKQNYFVKIKVHLKQKENIFSEFVTTQKNWDQLVCKKFSSSDHMIASVFAGLDKGLYQLNVKTIGLSLKHRKDRKLSRLTLLIGPLSRLSFSAVSRLGW